MDKRRFIASDDAQREDLFTRVFESAMRAEKFGGVNFTPFCSETESEEIEARKKNLPDAPMSAWGGYEGAFRKMLAFGEAKSADFPIAAIEISGKNLAELTHRDYLGSILSCGITRECVGDICVGEGGAVAFIEKKMALYVLNTLTAVGGCSVQVRECKAGEISVSQKSESVTFTLASLRLDAYTASLLHLSRDKAAALIEAGRVFLNQRECQKCDEKIKTGDIVTVRGAVKSVIESVGGVSKKGRIYVSAKKYN